MPTDQPLLLHRLVCGDTRAASEILALATTNSASALVAAATLARDPAISPRATEQATVARGHQPGGPTEAHLAGNAYLLEVLVRDHLANRTDHWLAARIAGQPIPQQ